MNKESERQLLENIIKTDGDCINYTWCLACPFATDCVYKAVTHARLLPKEERVRRAFNKLFTEVFEEEIN